MADGISSLEKATESVMAKALLRFGMPVLVAVLGWFVNDKLAQVQQQQNEQKAALQGQTENVRQIASDMRVMSTRIDLALAVQIQSLERRVESLEQSDTRARRAQAN
jgi:hypothetical protein